MLSLLVRNTVLFALLCRFVVIFDAANAAIEFVSNTELVEKYLIDSVPRKDAVPETTESETTVPETPTTQPDAPVPPKTEEASGPSSMVLDVPSGLCAAEEELKLGFCRLFLENEISFNFNFERETGNFVCERRKIVLTRLNQSNLNGQDETIMYQCPRLVESDLVPEIYNYYVAQARADSPVVVYTQRNSYSRIHPFKAVLNVDSATLASTRASYYPMGRSLPLPMDLSRTEDADQLLEKARRSVDMKKLTRAYEKFVSFFGSFDVCGMTTMEKLFACKYYVLPGKEKVEEYVEMEADVDPYRGSFAYKGSECRRRETVLFKDGKKMDLDFGVGVSQFRCPPMARYELQQGTSDSGALLRPKIYFDHTVRLVSSHFDPSTAFLLNARYHQVALAAAVSGIENENLRRLASLRRLSRWRPSSREKEGSYEPAQPPDQYAPIQFIEMSRNRAEEVIFELKGGHVALSTHKKFETFFPKISLATYKSQADRVRLCNEVFGHQAFGYEIEAAEMRRKLSFELYVNRLDFHIDDSNKWLPCFWCKPKEATIYADLFVAAGTNKGGVVVLVRDFKADVLTPLAVAYPESATAKRKTISS